MNKLDFSRKLDQIRPVDDQVSIHTQTFNSIMLFVGGNVLGYITKLLNALEIDNSNGLHRFIETTSLAQILSGLSFWLIISLAIAVFSASYKRAALNTFLMLSGMCVGHHIYCILHSISNPFKDMMGWYILTVVATLLAAICWYGKGLGKEAIIIDIIILMFMTIACFSVGHWFIKFDGIANTVFYIATVIILHRNMKITSISVLGGVVLAILIGPLFPF